MGVSYTKALIADIAEAVHIKQMKPAKDKMGISPVANASLYRKGIKSCITFSITLKLWWHGTVAVQCIQLVITAEHSEQRASRGLLYFIYGCRTRMGDKSSG